MARRDHPRGDSRNSSYPPAETLTLGASRAIAERKPSRVVLLDEGFAKSDQLEANAAQLFRTKGVASFRTV